MYTYGAGSPKTYGGIGTVVHSVVASVAAATQAGLEQDKATVAATVADADGAGLPDIASRGRALAAEISDSIARIEASGAVMADVKTDYRDDIAQLRRDFSEAVLAMDAPVEEAAAPVGPEPMGESTPTHPTLTPIQQRRRRPQRPALPGKRVGQHQARAWWRHPMVAVGGLVAAALLFMGRR